MATTSVVNCKFARDCKLRDFIFGLCMSDIVVRGAREHNLDDVHLRLPRNKFICFSVSGSGKVH